MSEKIIEALKKLLPTTDGHWTQNGEPAVQATSLFAGVIVKREDIDAAAPGFKRDNAATYFVPKGEVTATETTTAENTPAGGEGGAGGVATTEQPVAGQGAPGLPTLATEPTLPTDPTLPTQGADTAAGIDAEVAEMSELDKLRNELKFLDQDLADLGVAQNRLTEELNKLNKERDAIVIEIDRMTAEATAQNGDEATLGYLRSREAQIAARAAHAQQFKDSGLTIEKIKSILPHKSPLDMALAGRRNQQ